MTYVRDEFKTIEDEFSRYRQAAGLKPLPGRTFDTPDDYRKAQIRTLQATLPRDVPATVRATISPQATADVTATTGQRVKDAVLKAASEGPVLREVITHDRTGRECREYYGPKRGAAGWMEQFAAVPQVMTRLGDAKL